MEANEFKEKVIQIFKEQGIIKGPDGNWDKLFKHLKAKYPAPHPNIACNQIKKLLDET